MIRHTRSVDGSSFVWPWNNLSPEDTESLLEQDGLKGTKHRYILRDFLASRFPAYCEKNQVSEEKLKVMNSLISCKTGKLGYTLTYCPSCDRTEMHACACGNRNCPSCGYLEEQKWVALRQSEVIPDIPYFHLVFTLPHSLNMAIYQNQKETLNILFRSVKDTVLALSEDKLKMVPGIIMVLHTFGSTLSLHYHLHVLVSGGGLSKDKTRFKRCLSNKFFLPVKAISRVYRGKFMEELKSLYENNKLFFYNDALKYPNHYEWKELVDHCYSCEWNVEARYLAPVSDTPGESRTTDTAVRYLARYTNRTAISNSRVISYNDDNITFLYKDYNNTSYTTKPMTLSADEFIRRFLMHILPKGFCRIRSAGFLAGCVRKKNLGLIHELMDSHYCESPVKTMSSAELILHFYGHDVSVCGTCNGTLVICPRMVLHSAGHFIRASSAVCQ